VGGTARHTTCGVGVGVGCVDEVGVVRGAADGFAADGFAGVADVLLVQQRVAVLIRGVHRADSMGVHGGNLHGDFAG